MKIYLKYFTVNEGIEIGTLFYTKKIKNLVGNIEADKASQTMVYVSTSSAHTAKQTMESTRS